MKIRSNSRLVMLTLVLVALAAVNVEAASLNITLSTSSITFPDQNPDIYPVTQQNGSVSITITTNGIKSTIWYSCSAQALGDLVDSSFSTIPISNVKWTAVTANADPDASFLSSGTLSKSIPVTVASGKGKDNAASSLQGDLTFFIDNLWTYATGNYSQTVNFTVSAP